MTTGPQLHSASNRRVLLASRPEGEPVPENYEIADGPLPTPGADEVLLRNIYLSLDPYMRQRMSTAKSYAAHLELGDVMLGATVSEVVESRLAGFSPGDIVLAYGGWQEFSIGRKGTIRGLDTTIPVTTALGILGMPGFTAYAGLEAIGKPQPGETVAVAAATGPVGSMVGQIAKQRGCTTVGIAGGPQKVEFLQEIGFDVALDHRDPDFAANLKAAVPQGIDVYFENVGGHVWDAVLRRLNLYARVPVCGLVASYNGADTNRPDQSPFLMSNILNNSLTLRGFIQSEFQKTHFRPFLEEATQWFRDGKLVYREHISQGLESAPEAFNGMLRGENFGKTVVQIAEDPTQ